VIRTLEHSQNTTPKHNTEHVTVYKWQYRLKWPNVLGVTIKDAVTQSTWQSTESDNTGCSDTVYVTVYWEWCLYSEGCESQYEKLLSAVQNHARRARLIPEAAPHSGDFLVLGWDEAYETLLHNPISSCPAHRLGWGLMTPHYTMTSRHASLVGWDEGWPISLGFGATYWTPYTCICSELWHSWPRIMTCH